MKRLIYQRSSLVALLLLLEGCAFFSVPRTVKYIHYPVQKGDTVYDISRRFDVSIAEITQANRLSDPDSLEVGQKLKVPYRGQSLERDGYKGKHATATAQRPRPDSASQKTVSLLSAKKHIGAMSWPVRTGELSSRFGRRWFSFHEGIDLSAAQGTPIYAAHDGVVVYSGNGISGYGNLIIIRGDGIMTVYAHNRSNRVRRGERVAKKERIGEVGATGKATGAHLHFETRVRDKDGKNMAVDPLVFYP